MCERGGGVRERGGGRGVYVCERERERGGWRGCICV